jgi:hypothetical protein
MSTDTLLVIGIHREELAFGDRVCATLDNDSIHVMRIPHGIPQKRPGTGEAFYATAEHREIYLQLWQQVRGRYRLVIDLHCGLDEDGPSADVFCHAPQLLACLAGRDPQHEQNQGYRLIRIVDDGDARAPTVTSDDAVQAEARTWIPRQVWDDHTPVYVGLEVYLGDGAEKGAGSENDWRYAQRMIHTIRSCATD